MKSVKIILMLALFLLPVTIRAMEQGKPELLDDQYYTEYWEQHVMFEDGTLVTSQFLIANFPWPVGDDHAIMVSTVVSPDGKRTIIKNGRNPGEWGFDSEKFDLYIHTHRLKQEGDQHIVHIGGDNKNTVNLRGITKVAPLAHQRYIDDDHFMEATVYRPYFEGTGAWKILPSEEGGAPNIGAGKFQGFATHVKLNAPLDDLLVSWLRVSGLKDNADDNPLTPFLSVIERPEGEKDIILTLKAADGTVTRFSDVIVKYKDKKDGDNGSSHPSLIELSARNGTDLIKGTIRVKRRIDYFNITDHLNFFEKGFASSRASVSNYRYVADYDLQLTTPEGPKKISGKALSEYADVVPPTRSKKKKRHGRGGRR